MKIRISVETKDGGIEVVSKDGKLSGDAWSRPPANKLPVSHDILHQALDLIENALKKEEVDG